MIYTIVNLIFLFILDVQARCCDCSYKSQDAQYDKKNMIREKYNDKNKLMRSGRVKKIINTIRAKNSNDSLYNEYLRDREKIAEEDRDGSLLNNDQKIEIVNNAIYNFLKIVYDSKKDNMDIYDFPKSKENGDKSKEEVDKSKEDEDKLREDGDKSKEGKDKIGDIVLGGLKRIGYNRLSSIMTATVFRTMMEKIMGNFGIVSKALSGLSSNLNVILNFLLQEGIVIKINPDIFSPICSVMHLRGACEFIKGFSKCSSDDGIDKVLGFGDDAYDKFIIELETRKASKTEKDMTFLVVKQRNDEPSGGYSDLMGINIKKLKDDICQILKFYFEILHVFYIYKEILKKELYVYYFNKKIYIYTPKVSSINKDFDGVLPADLCGEYTRKYRLNNSLLSNIIIDLPNRQNNVSTELIKLSKAYDDINAINVVNGAGQDKENKLNEGREKLKKLDEEIMFFDEFCKKLKECIIGQCPSESLGFKENKYIFTNAELGEMYFCKLNGLLSKNGDLVALYNEVVEKYGISDEAIVQEANKNGGGWKIFDLLFN